MAYNNYFPQYQPQMMGYGQYPTMNYQQQQATIQNSGFVSVPSEVVARNYPVAPGNSVTFIDENAPYCYTKTMGFSQLDRPKFEKFKLVKEEEPLQPPEVDEVKQEYALKSELNDLSAEIEIIKKTIEKFSAREVKEGNEGNGEPVISKQTEQ